MSGTVSEVRRARASDAQRLYEIRRAAILTLAQPAMSEAQANEWADRRLPEWAERLVAERSVWVYDLEGRVIGWGSATGSSIDGLYTDPAYARRGIGSRLLRALEADLYRRDFRLIYLHASWNAEAFYVSRGYMAERSRRPDGTLAFSKILRRT